MIHIDCDCNGLFTGSSRKCLCLAVANQLYRCFFHLIFLIIFGIRCLCIKFYDTFSVVISDVLYINGYRNSSVLRIPGYICDFLCKLCIGKSVSEWIYDFLLIVPVAFTVHSTCRRHCISLSHDCIFISCLVVFITYINTFLIYHIGMIVIAEAEVTVIL